MYEALSESILRELDALDEKYASGKSPMNSQDLEHIDKMVHALKCLVSYEAMKGECEGYRSRSRRYDDYRRY